MAAWNPQANELFLQARAVGSADERQRWLDDACQGNDSLRAQVMALLTAEKKAGAFLESGVQGPQSAVEPPVTDHSDTVIGPYHLIEVIGKGGMGTVWLAEQTTPVKRTVALKLINPGMDSRQVIARFNLERQAIALMDHPNIAKVLDAGSVGSVGSVEIVDRGPWTVDREMGIVDRGPWTVDREELAAGEGEKHEPAGLAAAYPPRSTVHGPRFTVPRPYFVMELVRGVPITTYCDQHRLSLRERLELFVPICQAIQHAHNKGIIHRDIKPSNVLVALYDGKPVPKVIDFGVAKAVGANLIESGSMLTGLGTLIGTLEYMSPEQAELNAVDIDTRSDIYALGVLLYELLTGSTPFPRQRLNRSALAEALRVIREEEPPRPSARLSESSDRLAGVAAQRRTEPAKLPQLLRGDLDWVLMKALDKDRERRYETANGLALDVQRYLNDEAVLACPPSATYRVRKFARRNKGMLTAATLVMLALVAGIISTTLGLLQARQQRDVAEQAQAEEARERQRAENERVRAIKAEGLAKANEQTAKDQEQKALAAAAEGRAVLEFFQAKVLAAARPEGQEYGLGVNATIRAAADAAEPRIAESFRDSPLVEASVRDVLGSTYWYLGEANLAIVQHERALNLRKAKLGPDHPDTLTSMNNLASDYQAAGRLEDALPLCEETLKLRKLKLGPDHPDTLTSMNNLAEAYRAVGRLNDALPLCERSFELRKHKLGPDHQDTLVSMSNLALAYNAAGRFSDSLRLAEETLRLRKLRLGPDHPDTLTSMNNLAEAYRAAGRVKDALPFYEQTVELRKVKLGADHPTTLTNVDNLAGAYRAAGRLKDALPLYEETLKLRKAKLGADHPDTLLSMNNLATAYQTAGRHRDSLPLFVETLKLSKLKRGPDHPDTLISMNNLASAYGAAGRLKDALPLYEEALELRKAKLGADHPDTLTSISNLAVAYYKAGRLNEALPLFEETLKQRKVILGPDHPVTLISMNNLAGAYVAAGRLKEALPLHEETLKLRKLKLGPEHPDTLTSMSNLADAYRASGRIHDALPLLEETLKLRRAKLGKDHLETIISMNNLAGAYESAGRLNDAIALHQETLALCKMKLGHDHPITLTSMNNLAEAYVGAGRTTEALPLHELALKLRRSKLGPAHPDTLVSMENLAEAYEAAAATDDLQRAEPLWRELVANKKRIFGGKSTQLASQLALLGINLTRQKKYEEAEQVLRDCLAIRDTIAPELWTTFNTKSLLGGSLLGQMKFEEAEPLLLQGYEGMKQRAGKIPEASQVQVFAALERLVQLYEVTDQADQASQWREQLAAAKAKKK